jgi:hypothetical protein
MQQHPGTIEKLSLELGGNAPFTPEGGLGKGAPPIS